MIWSATQGRFVVLGALFLLAWYVSVLLGTNAGWGWLDPEYAAPWIGRQLARGTSVVAAVVVAGAAIWRPSRWTMFAPALVAALGLVVIRRLYLIGSPPDYFLSDQAIARWYVATSCLLQIIAPGLTLVPPIRRTV